MNATLGSKTFGKFLGMDAFLGLQLGVYPADPFVTCPTSTATQRRIRCLQGDHGIASGRVFVFSENPRRPEFSTTKKGGFLDLTCTFLQLHHHFWCGRKILDSEDVFFLWREICKVDHKSITFDHKMRDEWCLHLGEVNLFTKSHPSLQIHQLKSIVRLILPRLLM